MAVTLHDNSSIVLGEHNDELIRVSQEGLESGTYILGKQGSGKSFLLLPIILQKIAQGEAVFLVDPHGDLCREVMARMVSHRIPDTYYFDLKFSREYPFGMNICALPRSQWGSVEAKEAVRNSVLHAFGKIWKETLTGLFFEKMLRHVVDLLVDNPELTMAHIPLLLLDDEFRQKYTRKITNRMARTFWLQYEAGTQSKREKETQPLLDRLDKLLSDTVIEQITCQRGRHLDLHAAILERKIILLNLRMKKPAYKYCGKVIGTFFMAGLQNATFDLDDLPYDKRPPFTIVVDEFSEFGSDESYEVFLSQARKYRCQLILAHQYRGQLDKEGATAIKEATTTCYTRICMSCDDSDSKSMANSFKGLSKEIIDIKPVARMDLHPNPAVKKFVSSHLAGLLQAKDLRTTVTGTTKLYAPTQGKYIDFENTTPPKHDFGFGTVAFYPHNLSSLLENLDWLLYFPQEEKHLSSERLESWLADYCTLVGADRVETEEYKKVTAENERVVAENKRKKEEAKKEWSSLCERERTLEKEAKELKKEDREYEAFLGIKDRLEQQIKQKCWDALFALTCSTTHEKLLAFSWSDFFDDLLEGRGMIFHPALVSTITRRAVAIETNKVLIVEHKATWERYCRGEFDEDGTGTHIVYSTPKEELDIEAIYEKHGFDLWVMSTEQKFSLQNLKCTLQGWCERFGSELKQAEERRARVPMCEREREIVKARQETKWKMWRADEDEGIKPLPERYRVDYAHLQEVETSLREVIAAFIAHPLTTDECERSATELADVLQKLKKREALVNVGGRVQRMRTVDVTTTYPALSDELLQKRRAQITYQTIQKYCQDRETVEREIEAMYTQKEPCEARSSVRVVETELVTTRRGGEQPKISEGAMMFTPMPLTLREISGWDFSDESEY